MKRLTEKDWKDKCEGYPWNVHPVKDIDDLPYYKKLAAYEDDEEQGLLLRLPCKVGDILYFAHHDRVIFSEVLSVKYHVEAENHGIFIRERLTIDVEGISAEIDFCDIGKNVFLTRAEAEAKLKEMERSHAGE